MWGVRRHHHIVHLEQSAVRRRLLLERQLGPGLLLGSECFLEISDGLAENLGSGVGIHGPPGSSQRRGVRHGRAAVMRRGREC